MSNNKKNINNLINNEEHVNGLIRYLSASEKKNKERKAKKIERPELKYTEKEAQDRAKNLIKFLKLTHPGNTGTGFKKPIEIKFLLRGDGASYNFFRPTLLYNLDEPKTLEVLARALYDASAFSHCCYYSLYNFNNREDVRVSKTDSYGRKVFEHKPVQKIMDGNTGETWVLPIDMDKISREEYKEHRENLLDLGIETIGLSSGFGYQSLILLNEPIEDKDLYQEFTTKIKKLIESADGNINVPTQAFRSPYTRNCKEYSSHFEHYKPNAPEAKEVVVLDWTQKRYSKEEVFAILDAEIERIYGKQEPANPEAVVCEALEEQTKGTVKENKVEVISSRSAVITSNKTYQDLYQHLNFDELPLNIQNILKGASDGLRNKCVLYLTPFLNKILGLTQEQALETLGTFNNLCTPPKPFSVVKSDYYRFSEVYADYTTGKYDPEMAQIFGKEELDTLIKEDIDKIFFDNTVIKKFNEIHHSAIQIYLAMKLLEIKEEKKVFTKEEIAKAAGISEKTVQRRITELTKFSLVINVPGNTRKGIKKGYRINEFGQYMNGFTKLSKLLVKDMLRELIPSQMVVYIYLKFKFNAMNATGVFTSQSQIASDVGLDRTAISIITDALKEKEYIRKTTVMGKQNRKKTTYTLRVE